MNLTLVYNVNTQEPELYTGHPEDYFTVCSFREDSFRLLRFWGHGPENLKNKVQSFSKIVLKGVLVNDIGIIFNDIGDLLNLLSHKSLAHRANSRKSTIKLGMIRKNLQKSTCLHSRLMPALS